MYKDLVSLPNISINNGFQEEYWVGHRMNHYSSTKKNITRLFFKQELSTILKCSNCQGKKKVVQIV
jgi:hypothetical protein